MSVRAFLWKAHRWVGLACLIPLLLLSLTGFAMLFERSWPAWTDATAVARAPAGIDRALASLRADMPGARIGMILPGGADGGWSIALRGDARTELVAMMDPATGDILRVDRIGTSLHDILLDAHNSLLIGLPGKLLLLATAIGILFLGGSGFAIMRRRLKLLRGGPLTGPSPAAAMHKWFGLAGLLMILLWAATGFLLLGFKMLADAGPGSAPSPQIAQVEEAGTAAPLLPMVEAALRLRPGTEVQAVMPGAAGKPVMVILLDRGAAPWSKSSTLMFDRGSGKPLPRRPVPGFMKFMIAAKSLHTGLWDGPALRGVYLIFALFPLILCVTGGWMWFARRPRRRPVPKSITGVRA